MSITKAIDVAFVRFRAPDLNLMRRFLLDFGMADAKPGMPEGGPIYMRGAQAGPFIHATEQGDPGFAGYGIWVKDRADLDRLAAHDRVPVEALESPGGGFRVRLTDPDGFTVDVVAGQQMAPIISPTANGPWNQNGEYPRIGEVRRLERGPAHVLRLGHVVLAVKDFRRSEAWYKERFGLITSDEIQPAPGVTIGGFMRCDRGEEPCDHHTLFLFQAPHAPAFMHAAFEVRDLDDLMVGHDYLERAGHKPYWGVGRHVLGSQVFDYWLDPWGHEIEHWTDGDKMRAADGGGIGSLAQLLNVQWGMHMPPIPGLTDAPPDELDRVIGSHA
ncbi:VOC family protein [Phenylobacterium montanum]|uniref:VOC family protein n=1 Tax=Phenylobacterium montanum TaxID=2823693 RepID=A0A975G443_9CAUL|nr:VOC family protein [Caulobacter sp. S6]QUD90218.1 VOC family protein [Caulobacter sp. S6]